MTARVAIYAVPGLATQDAGARLLRERAETWLGRSLGATLPDSAQGARPDAGLPDGFTRSAADEITVSARRYGFHGTLKAPFALAPGRTLDELERELDRFGAQNAPVTVPNLELVTMGGFFALVAGQEAPELRSLADALVVGFDDFRATLTPEQIARRNPEALTPRQRELLERWGYPFVFDEFRFHLTVTDRIRPTEQPRVSSALARWFAESLGRTVTLDALALCTEAEPGAPFALHSVHRLNPTATPEPEGTR